MDEQISYTDDQAFQNLNGWRKILHSALLMILILDFLLTLTAFQALILRHPIIVYYALIAVLVVSLVAISLYYFLFKLIKKTEYLFEARMLYRQKQQEKATHALTEKLTYEMQELGLHNEKMQLLIELSEIVQACATIEEAAKAIVVKCKRILHFADGTLYVMDTNSRHLELVASWGEPAHHSHMITFDQCWALRRGGLYHVKNPQMDLTCEHIAVESATAYMCIPLMAQNAIIGLLHLDFPRGNISLSEESNILISAITETLSLALANIRLRQTLSNQSLHDSLTGLYNRRYLEEFLIKAISIAKRNHIPLAILLLDIDYFKHFNDQYAHEAGDLVLQEFAKLLQNEVRDTDMTCRYGGDEFLCILHNCNLENAKKFAKEFKNKIVKSTIYYENRKLDPITLSIGIAIYPEDGLTPNEIIERADKALHAAKKKRNQITAYAEINNHGLNNNSSNGINT